MYIVDRYLHPYSVLSGGFSPQQARVKEYSIKENRFALKINIHLWLFNFHCCLYLAGITLTSSFVFVRVILSVAS